MADLPNSRVLIYSHDSFGLGHLRRCRAIAHYLVGANEGMSVLILSGSPIIGSFDFRARVDFVRIPGVIKLRNGEYTSLSLHIGLEQTLAIRASIIEHTAAVFDPDIMIVDKEPLGLRGEVRATLENLKASGTRLVLGLRDVLDDPDVLRDEWERKEAFSALENIYDDIWVYGLQEIYDPLADIGLSETARAKTVFTGYLRRTMPTHRPAVSLPFGEEPYILVTPGGGGDGIELVDWVMRAYEAREEPLFPALILLGPFMDSEHKADFAMRAQNLRYVRTLEFTPTIEPFIEKAIAIVGMGGYNTFCEAMSFDRPTLLVPRVVPRREQAIRADRAAEVGLLQVLPIDHYADVDLMIEALAQLPKQPTPSAAGIPNLLNGLKRVGEETNAILRSRSPRPVAEMVGATY
ncbi:MAG: hypothetical protein KDJ16_15620 [Hyphomicrobiales bacterium]|nr:hypothetical protein [Hyphomicrobiales bacterium]